MRLALLSLLVRDYDEAIGWYCDRLGFHVVEDTPLGGEKRWVVVAPSTEGSAILLARARGERQERQVGDQAGGRVFLFLQTDNLARDRQRMERAGVRFCEPTRQEPYGRVAVFEDLYGNRWDLVQPVEPGA